MKGAADKARDQRLREAGYRHTSMWLDPETTARLQALSDHHRLDKREVVRRLLLDIPLGRSDHNPMGLSQPERLEMEAQLRERHS